MTGSYGFKSADHASLFVLLRYTYEGTGNDADGPTNGRSDPCIATSDGSYRGPARGSNRAAAQGSLLGGSQARASKREHC